MEEESRKTLQSIFEGIEDPRVDRTKLHRLTSYHHHRDFRGALWSGRMGRNRVFWQNERGVAENLFGAAQWHSLTRYGCRGCLPASIPSSLRSVSSRGYEG